MSTRREFLLNCAAFTAAAGFVPTTVFAAPSRLRAVALDSISAAAWMAQLNSFFIAQNETGAFPLQLAAVDSPDAAPGALPTGTGDVQERFSLFFVGDAARPLSQDTYIFEHASLGRFPLFIVPIWRPDGGRSVYEAVFDRPGASARTRARHSGRNR